MRSVAVAMYFDHFILDTSQAITDGGNRNRPGSKYHRVDQLRCRSLVFWTANVYWVSEMMWKTKWFLLFSITRRICLMIALRTVRGRLSICMTSLPVCHGWGSFVRVCDRGCVTIGCTQAAHIYPTLLYVVFSMTRFVFIVEDECGFHNRSFGAAKCNFALFLGMVQHELRDLSFVYQYFSATSDDGYVNYHQSRSLARE